MLELTPTQCWFQRAMEAKLTKAGAAGVCESLLQAVAQEGGVDGAFDAIDRLFNTAYRIPTYQGNLVAGRVYVVYKAVCGAQTAVDRARRRVIS